jgi:serine/threonine protein kinase
MAELPTKIGSYDIERLLATGIMSDVYKGRTIHPQTKTPVYHAVKVLNPKIGKRIDWCAKFHSELKSIIKDEHLLEYKELEFDPKYNYYFVADFLECKPASRQSLRRERSHEILDCFIRILQALEKAHKKGYIHGNIKPTNVIVRRGEGGKAQAILSDWGLTYIYDAAGFPVEKFQAVAPYMSPERVNEFLNNVEYKQSKLTPASDTYALGATLIEALSGTRPFAGCGNAEELDKAKQSKKYLLLHVNFPVRHVNIQKLNEVVRKSVAYDAGSRYGSAGEFAQALEGCKLQEEKKA